MMKIALIFVLFLGVSAAQKSDDPSPATAADLLTLASDAAATAAGNVKREIGDAPKEVAVAEAPKKEETAAEAAEAPKKKKKKKRKVATEDAPAKTALEAAPANSLTDTTQAEKDKRASDDAFAPSSVADITAPGNAVADTIQAEKDKRASDVATAPVAISSPTDALTADSFASALYNTPSDSQTAVDATKRNVEATNPATIPDISSASNDKIPEAAILDATVADKIVKKRADDGISPHGEELMEKIYKEEKDMKKMMARIVREEKKMEKMLHKLEKLEKKAIVGLEEANGRRHGHRRPSTDDDEE